MNVEIISVNEAAELLIAALTSIVAGGLGGAPITMFLVSVFKHIPALDDIPSQTIQFVVGLVLTVLLWIAQALGMEVQFQSIAEAIVVIGPAVLSLLATLTGSSLLYQSVKGRAGFVRSEEHT